MRIARVECRMRDAVDEAREAWAPDCRPCADRQHGLGGRSTVTMKLSEPRRPIYDRVAQPVDAAGFAHQAIVGHMAIVAHPLQHLDRAVDGRTFFVAVMRKEIDPLELAAV